MSEFMSWLRHRMGGARLYSIVGVIAVLLLVVMGADAGGLAWGWTALLCALVLLGALLFTLHRRRKVRRASDALTDMLERPPGGKPVHADATLRAEQEALRKRMHEAVQTIRSSRLGHLSGRAALYELPWYITIGNPAAGKSSAIVNSGLNFPFEDGTGSIVKGIGGTRNCDWFFTTEGILLDTAGRYAVNEEDRREWLFFLAQLKKLRPLAPINGIVITASIAELRSQPPEFAISLARSLRQRIQELTESLEVVAPAYVMFTKADLVAGFNEFFEDFDWNERDRAWGATLPYAAATRSGVLQLFDQHFDSLLDGLRELGKAQMARAAGERPPPGLLSFPLEFAALRPALRAFIATLFEDNPFQFEPVFRGFYFTSALQVGESHSASDARVEERFALSGEGPSPTRVHTQNGFFLRDLFSRVIFADRHLVRQHAQRARFHLRQSAAVGAIGLLGLLLGGWTWSHANNRLLADEVRAELERVVQIQQDRSDLASRLAALEVLQGRIAALERTANERPLALGLGLYQGTQLKEKLLDEHHRAIRILMLEPVRAQLEADLRKLDHARPDQAPAPALASGGGRGATPDARPARVDDAYNTLKTYLMLGQRDHLDASHLTDQLARIWRGWLELNRGTMDREEMVRSAERILSFHLSRIGDPRWPLIENNPALVDRSRDTIRSVVRGMPAVERVYGDIRTRASTRYAAITVGGLVGPDNAKFMSGSHVVSGAFTAEAWRDFVRPAIAEAASGELHASDWVLRSATRDDLSLDGSPQQNQATLLAMYRKDYAEAWNSFLQGISIHGFDDFAAAVAAMDRLGDAQHSPIDLILRTVAAQTSGNEALPAESKAGTTGGHWREWFRTVILRRAPLAADMPAVAFTAPGSAPSGPADDSFTGLARLLAPREDGAALSSRYLQHLGLIRSRLRQIDRQGDPGAGAIALMKATLDDGDSELAATVRFVDEQMLAGVPDAERTALRPLLVRPLMQTFAALARPAERELNRIWTAQVHEPFSRRLAVKYPFRADADIEATAAEIAQIFGPEGAVARYVDTAMGALVVRRGDTIAPRTWGDLGVHLQPAFIAGFPRWVGPLEGAAAGSGPAHAQQTTFMLMPHPAAGTTGYEIEIDGQRLQYRNGLAQWATFVWPNPGGTPGARILATRFDGRTVEVANFPGRFGLEKLINSAERTRNADGSFVLAWRGTELPVQVGLRILSSARVQADGPGSERDELGGTLPRSIAGASPTPQTGPGTAPGSSTPSAAAMHPASVAMERP